MRAQKANMRIQQSRAVAQTPLSARDPLVAHKRKLAALGSEKAQARDQTHAVNFTANTCAPVNRSSQEMVTPAVEYRRKSANPAALTGGRPVDSVCQFGNRNRT